MQEVTEHIAPCEYTRNLFSNLVLELLKKTETHFQIMSWKVDNFVNIKLFFFNLATAVGKCCVNVLN